MSGRIALIAGAVLWAVLSGGLPARADLGGNCVPGAVAEMARNVQVRALERPVPPATVIAPREAIPRNDSSPFYTASLDPAREHYVVTRTDAAPREGPLGYGTQTGNVRAYLTARPRSRLGSLGFSARTVEGAVTLEVPTVETLNANMAAAARRTNPRGTPALRFRTFLSDGPVPPLEYVGMFGLHGHVPVGMGAAFFHDMNVHVPAFAALPPALVRAARERSRFLLRIRNFSESVQWRSYVDGLIAAESERIDHMTGLVSGAMVQSGEQRMQTLRQAARLFGDQRVGSLDDVRRLLGESVASGDLEGHPVAGLIGNPGDRTAGAGTDSALWVRFQNALTDENSPFRQPPLNADRMAREMADFLD